MNERRLGIGSLEFPLGQIIHVAMYFGGKVIDWHDRQTNSLVRSTNCRSVHFNRRIPYSSSTACLFTEQPFIGDVIYRCIVEILFANIQLHPRPRHIYHGCMRCNLQPDGPWPWRWRLSSITSSPGNIANSLSHLPSHPSVLVVP
jgi:hypothetical protein